MKGFFTFVVAEFFVVDQPKRKGEREKEINFKVNLFALFLFLT